MQQIAVLREIWRYPVKSMAGQALEKSDLYWFGLDGDRRYAFVYTGHPGSFPWVTARDIPEMVHFKPRYSSADVVYGPLVVETPDGQILPIGSEALRLALMGFMPGNDFHLLQLNRGTYDAAPVSLMGLATADQVAGQFGRPLDRRRFRQNLLVETADGRPFAEDEWCGRVIRFGSRPDSARILLNWPIRRCRMVNVDPDSAAVDPAVLKAVVRSRNDCLGVYGAVVQPGSLVVGEAIYLED